MSDKRIAEYLVKAEECRLEAGRASHEDESAAWLRMAEEWLRLSRGVAAVEQQDIHRKTRVDGETHPVHSQIVISASLCAVAHIHDRRAVVVLMTRSSSVPASLPSSPLRSYPSGAFWPSHPSARPQELEPPGKES